MSLIRLEYDPLRGGFSLSLGAGERKVARSLFSGLASAYLDERNHICAVESFWDHGGLPLRGIHQAASPPRGELAIEGEELRVGQLLLRQSPEKVELWFSTGGEVPRSHWSRHHDSEWGVSFWLSSRKVRAGWPVPGVGGRAECPLLAGIGLELARTRLNSPISVLQLSPEDFK